MENNEQLAGREYWDSTYEVKGYVEPLNVSGYKNYCNRQILEVKEGVGLANKSVLEIGGGGSHWLAYLAEAFPSSNFRALDYSAPGCELITEYAQAHGLENLSVAQDDFLSPRESHGSFDVVYSHGVVEHFPDLGSVLLAQSRFLAGNGRMITVIPNMAGINGVLTKKINRGVYDIHVPHDLDSFVRGHEQAGLTVLESGYLGSSNFSVLSSCFSRKKGMVWHLYVFLTRISKALWFLESKGVPVPATKTFSPYIYVVSSG